jgi:hypothetical protein
MRYGTRGCIPEEVNRVVASFSRTRDAGAISVCPLDTKNEMYLLRIFESVMKGL